ncbi:hypothetical protein AB0N31_10720 [Streptomyces sp. NPDC051051]|uniref:hypothetical protein n=1 Tax=Streptomyces sp. NPDC051051 TaxID=3155666 RepID=UPI003441E85E
MSSHIRALSPVQTDPGVLVHPGADRRLATEHWLLSTLPKDARERARKEWGEHRIAMLPLGTLFSAVRLPAHLVYAVAGGTRPSREVDAFLDEALDGGPVICDPHGRRYYLIVPASMPRTWNEAVDDWRRRDHEVDFLGRESYLGVPRLDVTDPDPAIASYWAVPMSSAATLCAPLTVARLISAAVHMLGKGADDAQD